MRIRITAFAMLAFMCVGMVFAKPFRRVMIFNGFGFQTAVFIGMLQAARDAGYPPDAIVGLCGGALAAAVANKFPDGESQLAFLSGVDFYRFLTREITVRDEGDLIRFLTIYLRIKYVNNPFNIVPDYFSDYLLDVPRHPDFGFDTSFTRGYIPVILQASRLLLDPQAGEVVRDSGEFTVSPGKIRKSGEKVFRMTYFTDEATKAALDPIESIKKLSLAGFFATSAVDEEVAIRSGVNIIDAIRASISDPYLMLPQEIDGEYYMTGAIDRLPVEFVASIADESFALYSRGYDEIMKSVFMTFGFDPYARLKYLDRRKLYPDYMVDISDLPERLVLDPGVDRKTKKVGLRIKEYESYRKIVREQYDYGYRRTLEALAFRNSLGNIRKSYIMNDCQDAGTSDAEDVIRLPSDALR